LLCRYACEDGTLGHLLGDQGKYMWAFDVDARKFGASRDLPAFVDMRPIMNALVDEVAIEIAKGASALKLSWASIVLTLSKLGDAARGLGAPALREIWDRLLEDGASASTSFPRARLQAIW
jgi:hypothetical protein